MLSKGVFGYTALGLILSMLWEAINYSSYGKTPLDKIADIVYSGISGGLAVICAVFFLSIWIAEQRKGN